MINDAGMFEEKGILSQKMVIALDLVIRKMPAQHIYVAFGMNIDAIKREFARCSSAM